MLIGNMIRQWPPYGENEQYIISLIGEMYSQQLINNKQFSNYEILIISFDERDRNLIDAFIARYISELSGKFPLNLKKYKNIYWMEFRCDSFDTMYDSINEIIEMIKRMLDEKLNVSSGLYGNYLEVNNYKVQFLTVNSNDNSIKTFYRETYRENAKIHFGIEKMNSIQLSEFNDFLDKCKRNSHGVMTWIKDVKAPEYSTEIEFYNYECGELIINIKWLLGKMGQMFPTLSAIFDYSSFFDRFSFGIDRFSGSEVELFIELHDGVVSEDSIAYS